MSPRYYQMFEHTKSSCGECHACARDYGRDLERMRCLEIVRQYYSCEMIAQAIEKKILGGNDGK